jgi:hypothetical protein
MVAERQPYVVVVDAENEAGRAKWRLRCSPLRLSPKEILRRDGSPCSAPTASRPTQPIEPIRDFEKTVKQGAARLSRWSFGALGPDHPHSATSSPGMVNKRLRTSRFVATVFQGHHSRSRLSCACSAAQTPLRLCVFERPEHKEYRQREQGARHSYGHPVLPHWQSISYLGSAAEDSRPRRFCCASMSL